MSRKRIALAVIAGLLTFAALCLGMYSVALNDPILVSYLPGHGTTSPNPAPQPSDDPAPEPTPPDVDQPYESFDKQLEAWRNIEASTQQAKQIVDLLDIDNPVILFAMYTSAPCAPYVLQDYNAYYCNINNTIYISSWVTTLPYGVQVFVYAHEDGHSEDPNFGYTDVFTSEQYADYYGGVRVCDARDDGLITEQDVQDARSWLAVLPPSDHGDGQQRLYMFDQGCSA